MPPTPQLVQLGQGLDSRTSATVTLAIASPCSTCSNRRTVTSKDGKPACPRMAHIYRQSDSDPDPAMAHLALTGLEYNPFATSSPGVLTNPVYDVGRGSIYIWVARLIDNPGRRGDQGQQLVPSLNDPTFLTDFTDYIQCSLYPVIPADTLAGYFAKGRIKEGQKLMVVSFRGQQLAGDQEVMVDGVAFELAHHGDFPIQSRPAKDDHPRGT